MAKTPANLPESDVQDQEMQDVGDKPSVTAEAKTAKATKMEKPPRPIQWRTVIPKYWNPSLPGESHAGFRNLGAQCYRNVIWQMILHSPVFFNWLLWYKHHHAPEGYECRFESPTGGAHVACKVCNLFDLFRDYWSGESFEASLTRLSARIVKGWKKTTIGTQEDAVEYFMSFFDQIYNSTKFMFREDLDDIFKMRVINIKRCVGEKPCQPTHDTEKHLFLTLRFPEAEYTSNSGEASGWSVSSALEQHFERIDDLGKCGKCGGRKVSQVQIGYLPEMLLIQINRVDENRKKITHHVQLSDPLTIEKDFVDERQGKSRQAVRYKLSSVIMHHGEDTKEGHYTIAAKGFSDQWTLFNDTDVSGWEAKQMTTNKDVLTDSTIFVYRRLPTGDGPDVPTPSGQTKQSVQPKQIGSRGTNIQAAGLNKDLAQSVATLMGDMIPGILDQYIARSEATRKKEWEKWISEREGDTSERGTKRKNEEEGGREERPEYDWNKARGLLEITLTEQINGVKGDKLLDLEVQGVHFNKLKGDSRKPKAKTVEELDEIETEEPEAAEATEGRMTRIGRKVKNQLTPRKKRR